MNLWTPLVFIIAATMITLSACDNPENERYCDTMKKIMVQHEIPESDVAIADDVEFCKDKGLW